MKIQNFDEMNFTKTVKIQDNIEWAWTEPSEDPILKAVRAVRQAVEEGRPFDKALTDYGLTEERYNKLITVLDNSEK